MGVGPVAQALDARPFDQAFLLADHDEKRIRRYREWLAARTGGAALNLIPVSLTRPTEFSEIYTAAVRACERADTGTLFLDEIGELPKPA